MKFRKWVIALCYLGLSGPVLADGPASVDGICAKLRDMPFPPGDRPGADAVKALADCDSEKLYYGIGGQPDPVAARNCAYAQLERADDAVWSGASILMMIYANGKGAARNSDLAIKLACQVGGAPAEREGRIEHLLALKTQGPGTRDFDLCDDITSGYMMGFCAAHEQRVQEAARQVQGAELTAKWSEVEKSAFKPLQAAATAFFAARIENEVDASGTARGALAIGEEESLRGDLLASLADFEKGKLPAFSAQQFSAADARLNALYKTIQSNRDFSWGTVTQQGIKTTQRLWIKYRDAWVEFGKLKYPRVEVTAWKTYFTEKRIAMLEEFANN